MIIGRTSELNQLRNYYERDKSQILVLYGQKYIGKTALINEFTADKPGFYFLCEPASEREQKYRQNVKGQMMPYDAQKERRHELRSLKPDWHLPDCNTI